MSKYILVYYIEDHIECGGGCHVRTFNDDREKDMHKWVNDLAKEFGVKFKILEAGRICVEFQYEPVKIITEFKPLRK